VSGLSIKIPNVSESLEDKLEALILGGAFWPDRPLASERRLADELDVSRTTLRNALASLKEKDLLAQTGGRFYPTNVLAVLLTPGLEQIGAEAPEHLIDYWLLFFDDALRLAEKKSRSSDQVEMQKAVRAVQKSLASKDAAGAVDAFDALCRSVLDGCYNYFLSQTHFALWSVLQPQIAAGFEGIAASDSARTAVSKALDAMEGFDFDGAVFRSVFSVAPLPIARTTAQVPDEMPEKLVDVVLRQHLFFEAIYELRLITEKHAAQQAAAHLSTSQAASLRGHLDDMTAVADTSPADYSRMDTELHQMIAACAHNPVFVVVGQALSPVFSRTTNHWLKQHLALRSSQTAIHVQHSQIVEAILRRDPNDADTEMVAHLGYVLRNLRQMREQDRLQEIATARRLLN